MKRTRASRPSPALDWRALAAPAARTVPTEPVTVPLSIEQRTDEHGHAVAMVTGIGTEVRACALDLRRWAQPLSEAADVRKVGR